MKSLAVFAALFTLGATSDNCGKVRDAMSRLPEKYAPRSSDPNRIVGGSETKPHKYPFMVSLIMDGYISCGGTLIAPDVVLTAAHCVDGTGIAAVSVGAHDKNHYEISQLTLTTRHHIVHENWDPDVVANDIALLKLDLSFPLNENISTAILGQKEPDVGAMTTAIGWGRTSDASNVGSDVLMEVEVPVIDDSEASEAYGNEIDFSTIFCISSEGAQGTCSGDSGGPLLNSMGEVVGLTSFGSAAGCEVGYPDCFTSVQYYIDWINSHL